MVRNRSKPARKPAAKPPAAAAAPKTKKVNGPHFGLPPQEKYSREMLTNAFTGAGVDGPGAGPDMTYAEVEDFLESKGATCNQY